MDENLITVLSKLFHGDNRRVMKQLTSGYIIHREGSINKTDWQQHINGSLSAAIYLLDENKKCSTVCFDVDIPKVDIPNNSADRETLKKENLLPLLSKIIRYLKQTYNISNSNLLIEDTGGRGYHLWLFFEAPQPGIEVVNFLNEVKISCELNTLEVFPPACNSGEKGYSKSLVRLPLGTHRKYNNSRSFFLHPNDFSTISYEQAVQHLQQLVYLRPDILSTAAERYEKILMSPITSYSAIPKKKEFKTDYLGHVGKMMDFCPAMSHLVHKAEKENDLNHNERFALAAILKNYEDGEQTLHEILSNCSNYDREKSSYQISTIKPCAISCKKLQSNEYGICPGWCNSKFEQADKNGGKPTPLWFSRLNNAKEDLQIDVPDSPLIEQLAALSNLYQAWQQALQQSVERDIFEDQLAFTLFGDDLWNNLEILRYQLLNHNWKHSNFLLIQVPKNKEEKTYRPFCSISPREAIVQLAILNVIGPKIDPRFNKNSLGNRLAGFPKVDSQIFLDWRRQNSIRELKKLHFAKLSPENHYVITDLKKFYEYIKHDKLISLLREYIDDQQVLELIQQFIEAPWERSTKEYGGELKRLGIPQGPALSALLANIYLNNIDTWLSENTVDFVRYVDDIVMVFENKETAIEKVNKLEADLLVNYGLTLSKEKTTDPLPVTESDKLVNWLDEVRYDFVKSSKTNIPLTNAEKNELLNTLKTLAGDVDNGDIKSITRYLGLYIRYTERLGDPLMLRTVYATAGFILQEDRPKHNATCIAVNSLVKACNEYENDAWQELVQLFQSRDDEYFQIILCQETGKIIRENFNLDHVQPISSKVLLLIEAISLKVDHPVAAAAAINALALLTNILRENDGYSQIAFGDNIFLRPRMLWLLNKIKPINETSLTRLDINSLFEVELFASMVTIPGTQVFKNLVLAVVNSINYQLALPRLLRIAIIFQEAQIEVLWHLVRQPDSQADLAYYIADKIISDQPISIDKAKQVNEMVQFLISKKLSTLVVELLRIARHHNLVIEDVASLKNYEFGELRQASETLLPIIPGISLNKPLFLQNYYVQSAADKDGRSYYYEYIDGRELSKVGGTISDYQRAMDILMSSNILLKGTVNSAIKNNWLVVVTPVNDKIISLKDYLTNRPKLFPSEVLSLIIKLLSLSEEAAKVLDDKSCKIFLPIPTLHTVFIDYNSRLYFSLVSLTIGSERRYVGQSGDYLKLQLDDSVIESLSLLFFELVTRLCAVTELVRNKFFNDKTIDRFSDEYGSVFTGIIKKANKAAIIERYAKVSFLKDDFTHWAQLEEALLKNENISAREKFLLRTLWNLEIHLHRRIISEFGKENLLIYANRIQTNILNTITTNDLHKEDWLLNKWRKTHNKDKFPKHVATAQAIAIGDAITSTIEKLHSVLGISKQLDLPLWLYTTAANIEMEALRRSLHQLIISEKYKNQFLTLKSFLLANIKENEAVSVFLTEPNDKLNGAVNCLQKNLEDLANRLDTWLLTDICPDANWSFDGLVILMIALGKRFGLTFNLNDGEYIDIRPDPSLFNKIDFFLFSERLVASINNDAKYIRKASFSMIRNASKMQAELRNINLQLLRNVNRYFDVLGDKVHMKFRLKQQVSLKITQISRTFLVSNEIIIHENHNHSDLLMNKGCPFSLDIEESTRNRMIPLLASFPILTAKMSDDKQYPILINYRLKYLALFLTRYRRRHPVISSFLDVHIAFLLITFVMFYIGIEIFGKTNPSVLVALNGFIYSPLAVPIIAYITWSNNKFKKQNPNFATTEKY